MMGGTPMDTYIVRIYRRKGKHPNRISGHVVKVEVQERQDFFDLEMLRNILDPMSPDTRQEGDHSSPRSRNNGGRSMVDLIQALSEDEKL
jgi:hypothetical protein